jgi:hypothetical protein
MKVIRLGLIVLFISLIILEICLSVCHHQLVSSGVRRILILSLLITIIIYRTRISWLLGIFLFSYSIYYFFFMAVYASVPSAIEFTYSLNRILFGNYTGNRVRAYIDLFPFIFYLLALIVFLLKPTRIYYNVASTKSWF